MQVCKYANDKSLKVDIKAFISKKIGMQVLKYASMQVLKYASMQVCKYARIPLAQNYILIEIDLL